MDNEYNARRPECIEEYGVKIKEKKTKCMVVDAQQIRINLKVGKAYKYLRRI